MNEKTSEIRAKISALCPGDCIKLPLPKEQPESRNCYRAIGAMANALFGVGNYRLNKVADQVWVWRIKKE